MTNEEMKTVRGLIDLCLEADERAARIEREKFNLYEQYKGELKTLGELREECNRLREREADALNANVDLKARCSEMMAERDDARSKLREVAVVLNDIWQDYKYINFKSKADKTRAKKMAAKIKAFAEAHKLELVQDKNGKWGVK